MPALAQQRGRVERELHAGPVADQRDALALDERLAACRSGSRAGSRGQRRRRPPRRAGSAARPARRRSASAVRSMWTSIASSRGAISDDVRDRAQVRDVVGAVVRRAVVADQPGAVHAEHDVQLLEADVVDDLVVRALQEGRVDRARPASCPRARARPRTAPRAARRCRRRSTGRAARARASTGRCRRPSRR